MKRLLAVAALVLANEEESSQQLQSYQYTKDVAPDRFEIIGPNPHPQEINIREPLITTDAWLHRQGPQHKELIYSQPIREVVGEPELIYRGDIGRETIVREPILREQILREPIAREQIIREPIAREQIIREPIVRETIREPSYGAWADIDAAYEPGWKGRENVLIETREPRTVIYEPDADKLPGNIDIIAIREPYENSIIYPDPVVGRPSGGAQFKYEQFPVWSKKPHKFADFYCPKPGFVMTTDNECCREARCDSRLECPWGFTFDGNGCFQYYDPTTFCTKGVLYDGLCRIVRSVDPIYECPNNSELDNDGNCYIWEQYTPMEVCPHATIRSKNGCLAVEYTEPTLVCPPDTVPDGKRCRREIITLKMKKEKAEKRLLMENDVEGEADELYGEALDAEEYEVTAEELEAMGKDVAYAYDDIYADIAVGGVADCDSIDCFEEWIPATSEFKIKTKKVKQPIVSEQLKWEKIKIPVTTAKVKDIKVKVPEVKVKSPKEKAIKSPHEVLKVVTQAAEKVCPIGVKHGSTCVAETIVPPVFECPHPQLGPDCSRKIVVPPNAICTTGDITCDAYGCRCETFSYITPEITCAGGHKFVNGRCVIAAEWQRMCPIGYFLEADGVTCAKIDCEPPLTVVAKPLTSKKKLPKKLQDSEEYDEEWDE